MSQSEKELLEIIRQCNDPQKAMIIAVNVITTFLSAYAAKDNKGAA